MRNEPYKAFEGEVFTLLQKKMYVLHQKVGGINRPVDVTPFDDFFEAEKWAQANRWELLKRCHSKKLFVRHDFDD